MTPVSTSALGLGRHCDRTGAMELMLEHGALLRQIAGLQRRVSEQQQASARRLVALEAQNLRLRAELVLLRTALLWNLRAAALSPGAQRAAPRAPAVPDPDLREAQMVICQTACAGHAHPWRDADGQCRRTGEACDATAQGAMAEGASPKR
jgi:hypothetical protein